MREVVIAVSGLSSYHKRMRTHTSDDRVIQPGIQRCPGVRVDRVDTATGFSRSRQVRTERVAEIKAAFSKYRDIPGCLRAQRFLAPNVAGRLLINGIERFGAVSGDFTRFVHH